MTWGVLTSFYTFAAVICREVCCLWRGVSSGRSHHPRCHGKGMARGVFQVRNIMFHSCCIYTPLFSLLSSPLLHSMDLINTAINVLCIYNNTTTAMYIQDETMCIHVDVGVGVTRVLYMHVGLLYLVCIYTIVKDVFSSFLSSLTLTHVNGPDKHGYKCTVYIQQHNNCNVYTGRDNVYTCRCRCRCNSCAIYACRPAVFSMYIHHSERCFLFFPLLSYTHSRQWT